MAGDPIPKPSSWFYVFIFHDQDIFIVQYLNHISCTCPIISLTKQNKIVRLRSLCKRSSQIRQNILTRLGFTAKVTIYYEHVLLFSLHLFLFLYWFLHFCYGQMDKSIKFLFYF